MDLLDRDATLDQITIAAYAIRRAHELAEKFLDVAPITAALNFAAEEIGATVLVDDTGAHPVLANTHL
jgi:hypothetical protein